MRNDLQNTQHFAKGDAPDPQEDGRGITKVVYMLDYFCFVIFSPTDVCIFQKKEHPLDIHLHTHYSLHTQRR
jgi:hypothetical protein